MCVSTVSMYSTRSTVSQSYVKIITCGLIIMFSLRQWAYLLRNRSFWNLCTTRYVLFNYRKYLYDVLHVWLINLPICPSIHPSIWRNQCLDPRRYQSSQVTTALEKLNRKVTSVNVIAVMWNSWFLRFYCFFPNNECIDRNN